jgi:hypothetical protein
MQDRQRHAHLHAAREMVTGIIDDKLAAGACIDLEDDEEPELRS